MQFVLNHQLGRQQTPLRNLEATGFFRRPPEASNGIAAWQVVVADVAKQGGGFAHPGQRGELVDRGNQEAGQAPVDLLVHRQHGKGHGAVEGAWPHVGVFLAELRQPRLSAVNLKPIWFLLGQQVKAVVLQRPVAPRTGFNRDGPVAFAVFPFGEQGLG